MRYHYVVSNIVLFALLQVHRNQQIVVLVPWLCGSVNLTANENIHHEEERTSFFCCSARFRWSRHQPGYVQGGQEVGRDYLLLRIHVRRIREHSTVPENLWRGPQTGFQRADDGTTTGGGHGG